MTKDEPMTNRYVPNGTPLTPHESELLVILMEECAEVIQAAAKLIRFGKENVPIPDNPDLTVSNSEILGMEIGDLYEMVEQLMDRKIITQRSIDDGMERKSQRLHQFMQTEPT
jgi:NTP pyrophosphatase (non-canonical NTP hydrolase)